MRPVLIACVLAVVLVAAACLVSIPYYAITPGSTVGVAKLIGVPKEKSHAHHGQILLVDVELTPLRAIEWPYFALKANSEIVGSSELLGPESASQYNVEGVLDMRDAQQAATVVALRQLGYKVPVRSVGALMYGLFPGSPAGRALKVGDVVTTLDGSKVKDAAELSDRLAGKAPGTSVSLGYESYPSGAAETATLTLSAWRVKGKGKNATIVCPPYGEKTGYRLLHVSPDTGKQVAEAPCIGAFDVETSYHVGKLPFRVDLSNEGIIGPSAGLAFTLGLIERLDPEDLTGGLKVAATGTMSIDGAIGDVGGVAQKTVAVRASGAKLFFVPPQEYKVAEKHAGSSLKVYPVSRISQVLKILRGYGGKLPSP